MHVENVPYDLESLRAENIDWNPWRSGQDSSCQESKSMFSARKDYSFGNMNSKNGS
jgi:hypothetical protein